MSSAADAITALEDQRWEAQIGADTDTLEALIDDALSYTHSNGAVDTKASYLKAIEKGIFDYRSENRTDVTVHVAGDTAMVTGRIAIEVVAGGREVNLDSRYSVIWAKGADGWRFLCWQSTPIAG